jgi:hypothetical protein
MMALAVMPVRKRSALIASAVLLDVDGQQIP